MDIDETLKSVNKYARDYIGYLAHFFDHKNQTVPAEHIGDQDGRIIVHAMISLTLGIYLKQVFVNEVAPHEDDILISIAHEVGFWLFFAIVVHLLTWLLVKRNTFAAVLSVILRVFPPAFMIAASSILFVTNAVYTLMDDKALDRDVIFRGSIGLLGGALVMWALVAFSLPFSLSQPTAHCDPIVPSRARFRKVGIVSLIVLLLVVSDIINIGAKRLFCGLNHQGMTAANECMPLDAAKGADAGKGQRP